MANQSNKRENAQVDKAYRQVSGNTRRPTARQIAERKRAIRNRKIAIITVCSVILVVLIGLIVGMIVYANRNKDDGLILNNVYAAGINLGGMTQEDAKNALHLVTDNTFTQKDMVIKLPDATITLPASETGAKLNVDKVVEAAYNYGRSGSVTENKKAQQNANTIQHTIALLSYMELDTRYIQNVLKEFCDSYSSIMTQPSDTISGNRPEYDPENPDISVTHQTLTITLGTPDYKLDYNRLYDRVLDAYSMNQLEISYEAPILTNPQVPSAQALFDKYCLMPENAQLDDQLNVIPEIYGYGFDVDTLQKRIDNAKHGETIQVTLNFMKPDVTSKELSKNVLPDVLVDYLCSNPDATEEWIHNMTLACEAINGKVVNAGENFSFNQLLGRITEANGFKKAPGYSKGMEAQVLGAGVEQVASALYYCALVCDFTILERHNSGYAVKYIDLGLDAYITGSQDLRFTNSSDHPIRILAEVDGNSVRVRIQGTDKRMYDIEIKSVIEETLEPEHIYKVVAKENVMGYEDGQILVSGITGYTVKVYRVKYNKQTGDETIRTIIDVSNYSKRDQVEVQIESDPIEDPQPSDPSEGTESQGLDNVLDVIDEIP
jgi:vancomycin resistance protein YoaR